MLQSKKRSVKTQDLLSSYDKESFCDGENYYAYRFSGVHPKFIDRKLGVQVTLWAPEAQAVSLIGDFNNWNINSTPLTQSESGFWTTWLASPQETFQYQFAIHLLDDEIKIVNDPFSFNVKSEKRYSSFFSVNNFKWHDQDWIKKRELTETLKSALIIKNIDLQLLKFSGNYNYQQIAKEIVKASQNEGFTHIELTNFIENVTDLYFINKDYLLYCPDSAFGETSDFKCMIDYLHQNNIGVVLNLPYFSDDLFVNYGNFKAMQKPAHLNFFLSNLIYWLEEFHIDGFNFGQIEQVLVKRNKKINNLLSRINTLAHSRSKGIFTLVSDNIFFNLPYSVQEFSPLIFDFKVNTNWIKTIKKVLGSDNEQKNRALFSSIFFDHSILSIQDANCFEAINFNQQKILLLLYFLLPSKKHIDQEVLRKWPNDLLDFFLKLSDLYKAHFELTSSDLNFNRYELVQIKSGIIVFSRWSHDFKTVFYIAINLNKDDLKSYIIEVPQKAFYKEIFSTSNKNQEDGVYSFNNPIALTGTSIQVTLDKESASIFKI